MKRRMRREPDDCGFVGNKYVLVCPCERAHQFDVEMTRESLERVKAHFDQLGERCTSCNRPLRLYMRHLSPWQSELDAMTKAAKWMTTDRNGVPPTAEDLWKWLSRNAVEPYDWEVASSRDEDWPHRA